MEMNSSADPESIDKLQLVCNANSMIETNTKFDISRFMLLSLVHGRQHVCCWLVAVFYSCIPLTEKKSSVIAHKKIGGLNTKTPQKDLNKKKETRTTGKTLWPASLYRINLTIIKRRKLYIRSKHLA